VNEGLTSNIDYWISREEYRRRGKINLLVDGVKNAP
jgi:hypothetical protein